MTRSEIIELSRHARCKDENDYQSERQINAENRFFDAVRQYIDDKNFEAIKIYALKATPDESIDHALERIKDYTITMLVNDMALYATIENLKTQILDIVKRSNGDVQFGETKAYIQDCLNVCFENDDSFMACNDCQRRIAYDTKNDQYKHLESPETGCFLIPAETA